MGNNIQIVKADDVKQGDLALINDLNAALQTEKHRGSFSIIIFLFVF